MALSGPVLPVNANVNVNVLEDVNGAPRAILQVRFTGKDLLQARLYIIYL